MENVTRQVSRHVFWAYRCCCSWASICKTSLSLLLALLNAAFAPSSASYASQRYKQLQRRHNTNLSSTRRRCRGYHTHAKRFSMQVEVAVCLHAIACSAFSLYGQQWRYRPDWCALKYGTLGTRQVQEGICYAVEHDDTVVVVSCQFIWLQHG